MTTKAKVIAGVVGGVLVVGGIGSAFNKDKDKDSDSSDIGSSIPQSVVSSVDESVSSESQEITEMTIDSFFEQLKSNEKFTNENKRKRFKFTLQIKSKSNISNILNSVKFYSNILYKEGEYYNRDKYFYLDCNFKNEYKVTELEENDIITFEGEFYTALFDEVSFNDCVIINVEKSAESTMPESTASSETLQTVESSSEMSTSSESESQSTVQESESRSEVSSVPSSISVTESASTPIQSTPPTEHQVGEVCVPTSGKGTKYHSNPYCSNMENEVYWVSVSEAEAMGRGPCSKCY